MGMGKRGNRNICAHVHGDGLPFSISMQPCSPPSLTSAVPPTIADDLTDVAVTRLSPAVLTCYTSGVPPPTVSWSKEGAQLGRRGGGYRVLPTGTGRGHAAPAGQWVPTSPPRCLPSARSLPRGPGDPAGAACRRRPLHLHGEERCWHSPKTPPARGARYAQLLGVPLPPPALRDPQRTTLPCCWQSPPS